MKHIKEKIMRDKIYKILTKLYPQQKAIDRCEATFEILSLMGENEIGVSDAPVVKHGVYTGVRESHASGLPDTDSEQTNSEALEKITEAKEVCHCINWHPSTDSNMGKKAVCSHCNRLRQ